MKARLVLAGLLAVSALWALEQPLKAQEKLDESTIISIVQSAQPEVKVNDVQVNMIKRLSNRTKINLTIKGSNAILYLTWQRSRSGARWWFEKDAESSLVMLSRTTGTARLEESAPAETPGTAPAGKPVTQTPPAAEQNAEKSPANEPVARQETTGRPAQPAERPKPVPAGENKPVNPPTEQPAVEKPAPVKEKTTPAEEPQSPVSEPPAAESAPADKAVTQPLNPAELPPAPAEKAAAANNEGLTSPGMPGETPFVPVELATGPDGTTREFVATLVMVLGKGQQDLYPLFLLRQTEMAIEVKEQDFNRGLDIWKDQFDAVHMELRKSQRIVLGRIILQKSQTPEIERATLNSLNSRIRDVDQVYTFVKINMTLDEKPAYISIGGLMHTQNGWRIGGRVELVRQVSIQ